MSKDNRRFKHILAPQMLPIHFRLFEQIMKNEGYNLVILDESTPTMIEEGLKYVHNDTCYPALVVIGQIIEAFKSGKYDSKETAVTLTQTGGGCRASNYLKLLRKALDKAGYGDVTVLSINMSGYEKDSSIPLNFSMIRKLLAGVVYGDLIMHIANQVRPYEINKGETDKLIDEFVDTLSQQLIHKKGLSKHGIKKNSAKIVQRFAQIKKEEKKLVKVGVVGEIFVKYSKVGNNNLEELLHNEGAEVRVPGLMGFLNHCISQKFDQQELYGGQKKLALGARILYKYTTSLEKIMNKQIKKHSSFDEIMPFDEVRHIAKEVCGLGIIMGEGWLLTAEMLALCMEGFENIVCTQPFGCLPNHIIGKGMVRRIKELHEGANIVSIDYDPSATKVNQENRIKLMLSVAKEKLK